MPRLDLDYLEWVHKFCFNNSKSLSKSSKCGCFCCTKIFSPNDIHSWIDGGKTARCPYCGVDSIIGEYDVPLVGELFLQAMYVAWFNNPAEGQYIVIMIEDFKTKKEVSLRPSLAHPCVAEIIRMETQKGNFI